MNYLEEVKTGKMFLREIPVEHRTYEVCLEAVKQSHHALKYVPVEYRSNEMCAAAVLTNFFTGFEVRA